jgi:hypothetical protein
MKKKLFRERYYGESITAEKAIELIDKGIKKLTEEKKSTKKGRKKND